MGGGKRALKKTKRKDSKVPIQQLHALRAVGPVQTLAYRIGSLRLFQTKTWLLTNFVRHKQDALLCQSPLTPISDAKPTFYKHDI